MTVSRLVKVAPFQTSSPNQEFTNIVQRISISEGRQNYVDAPNPGSISIVINNDNNEAKQFDLGRPLTVIVDTYTLIWGFVQSITYNDSPGLLKGSTATIQCVDNIGKLGSARTVSKVIGALSSYDQLKTFNSVANGGSGPLGTISFNKPTGAAYSGISQSAQTYSGTALQYLQTSQQTENNLVYTQESYIYFPAFLDQILMFSTAIEFDSTGSSTKIAYEYIDRNFLDSELANSVTVTPSGLAAQTGTNDSSIAVYEQRDYSRSTYDASSSTALSTAVWLSNVLSDRSLQTFKIRFTIEAQPLATWQSFMSEFGQGRRIFKLNYRPAGSLANRYEWVAITAVEHELTPDKTVTTLTCHPANMYVPAVTGSGGSTSFSLVGRSRYNLIPNPSNQDGSRSGYLGSNFTLSNATYPYTFIGQTSVKGVVSAVGTQQIFINDAREPSSAKTVVESSTAYVFSAYIYVPTTNTADTQWVVTCEEQTVAGVSTAYNVGTNTTIKRGVWTRLSVSFTTTSTTKRVLNVVKSVDTLAVGQEVYIHNIMLEPTSTLEEFFDGNMRPAEFIGTANDSISVLDSNYFRFGRTV